MNKLSKEKRNQLILVAMGTVGVIAALWFGLIALQRNKLGEIAKNIQDTQQQIDKVQRVVVEAAQIEATLKVSGERLNQIEGTMPSGDLFSWMVSAIKRFNMPSYKVDLPQIGVPVVSEVHLYPNYPYHQADVTVSGSAYYYDFGKFLSDFENHFPYMRIENLSLDPGAGSTADEREKLAFRMEIITLVKTNSL